jgi:hypothetical protein
LLGSGWRLPTSTEWTNVDASGNWVDYNGPWSSDLKMHAAGFLSANDNGWLFYRGSFGYYWSSSQTGGAGYYLFLASSYYGGCFITPGAAANGNAARCIRE